MPVRRVLALVRGPMLGVALVATLTGCGGGDDSADVPTTSSTASATTSSAASASATASARPTATATATSTRFPTYVALGDSYTAAPGVPTTETDDGCLRSDGNYPTQLAVALGSSLTDVSCSGARTTSLVGVQQTGTTDVPAQFDALSEDTSLVTLGMGGNDENLFSTAVVTCLQAARSDPTGHPCQDAETASGKDALLAKIGTIRTLATSALRGIADRSPSATVVMVGYPQPVPASGTCAALPLAAGDYAYVRSLFTALNRALEQAATRAGATYVDVARASRGHDICAADPWVNGAQNAPGRAIAFHPFAEEQQAVAGLIQQALGSS